MKSCGDIPQMFVHMFQIIQLHTICKSVKVWPYVNRGCSDVSNSE